MAPKVTLTGESSIPELKVKITSLSADRAAVIDGILTTWQMSIVGGKIINEGVIKSSDSSSCEDVFLDVNDDIVNNGEILGDCTITMHTLFNNKLIDGNCLNINGNILDNRGDIGNNKSRLKIEIQDYMLNPGKITGEESEFIFDKQKTFFNDGILLVSKLKFSGIEIFTNNNSTSITELHGSIKNILNREKLDAPDLSMKMDTVENHGIMKVKQLEISKIFKNQSTEKNTAVFLSTYGIKLAGASDFLANTNMINTDCSIPSEKSSIIKSDGLISGCHGQYIINARPNFWKFNTFDLERIKACMDFCVFVENQGESLLFSLFQKGTQKFSRELSRNDFTNFDDFKSDCFHLFAQDGNIACHFFNKALGIWYDFLFDFGGNIELSFNGESTTGVEHKIAYAFHTSGFISNRNPLAFFALITDSKALYNFSILKVQNYLFRYIYRYNFGFLDLKESHSSDTKLCIYQDEIFVPSTKKKPAFTKGQEDNYGTIVGDDTIYFGNDRVFNFYGIALFNNVMFTGDGNSLRVQDATCDIFETMSGALDSFLIKSNFSEAKSLATVGRLLLSPLKHLENEGIFLLREKSEINARNIFLTGLMVAFHSAQITYGQMVGNGTVLGSNSLTLSKQMASSSFPDSVKIVSPLLTMKNETEKSEKIFKEDGSVIGKFVEDIFRESGIARKGSEILEQLELEAMKKAKTTLGTYGNTNIIFVDLKKIGLSSAKIESLLALPYFYNSLAADLQILGIYNNISRSSSQEKDLKTMFQRAVFWKMNMEILAKKFSDFFTDYMELWQKAMSARKAGAIVGLGLEKFVISVEEVGKCEIVETITKDTLEEQTYFAVFDYVKQTMPKHKELKK
jgi:hypothetical protein